MAIYADGFMKIKEKIAICSIKHHEQSHIKINVDICKNCQTRICIIACPAHLYTFESETGKLIVDHTGCLECGTCMIICSSKGITWKYPEAGYGIYYRYG